MTIKALLFDLDGTLVDTAEDFVKVLNEQRTDYNLPKLCSSAIRNTVSDGARALTTLAFGGKEGESQFDAMKDELLARYKGAAGDKAALFEGMDKVLNACSAKSIYWGIITNKPRLYTDILLKKLNIEDQSLFDMSSVTLCPDDVKNSKPDPESLLLAAKRLNCTPSECVYVGDHIRDIAAGKAAGMITVAAGYGYIKQNDCVNSWNSDYFIDKPIDLLSLFLN